MHLDELHIQNFRCFEEISFKFPPDNIAVIVGVNGSGKSSVLDAIANLIMKLIDRITELTLISRFIR
jgi:predicted ATP-binding protein involved in virulence